MNKIIGVVVLSLILFSCKKEIVEEPVIPEPEPIPISAKFSTDVQPIFLASCGTGVTCHGTINAERGHIFETHAGASTVPETKILGAIKHQSGFSNMPFGSPKLSDENIAIIEAWINRGKLND